MTENEQFWREWFFCPGELGREVFESYRYDEKGKLVGNRVFLTEYSDFLRYIQLMQKDIFPCWASVLPFQRRDDPAVLEKLYFDFDCKDNIELAWSEASDFSSKIKRFYNADSLLCFSGNKGYNLYIWLKKTLKFTCDKKNELKLVYEKLQEALLKGTQYKTLDLNPYGDVKRVSRIPFSIHEKSGYKCIPIDLKRKAIQLSTLLPYKENGLSKQFVDFCLRKTDEQKQQESEKKNRWDKQKISFNSQDNKKIRPCLTAALSHDLSGSNGHSIRIAIATEFLNNGHSPEETAQLFKNQTDYDYAKSLFYSQDIAARAYRPYKCESLQQLGICLPKECVFQGSKKERGHNT
ncbi:MAG: hypothetical protein ABSD42_05910 [Candidatus Bathyarchaeia archaeon]